MNSKAFKGRTGKGPGEKENARRGTCRKRRRGVKSPKAMQKEKKPKAMQEEKKEEHTRIQA